MDRASIVASFAEAALHAVRARQPLASPARLYDDLQAMVNASPTVPERLKVDVISAAYEVLFPGLRPDG